MPTAPPWSGGALWGGCAESPERQRAPVVRRTPRGSRLTCPLFPFCGALARGAVFEASALVSARARTLAPYESSATLARRPVRSKRIALASLLRLVLLAAGACIVIASLRAAASVLAPVVAALFLALVIASPFPWLARRMPRPAAAVTLALSCMAVLVALGVMVGRWFAEIEVLYEAHAERLSTLPELGRRLASEYNLELPESLEAGAWIVDASGTAVALAAGAVSTILFMGFILAEMWGLPRKLRAVLGPRSERLALVARVIQSIKEYFRLKTLASAATGLITGAACAAMDVPLPGLWGFVAFALNYIPTIGSVVAAIPPVLLAALTLGWEHASVLALVYLAVNLVIGGWLEPKLLGDRTGLSPLVVLVSLAFWGWVWGPIGLLLAVPMTVVLKAVMDQTEELYPFALLIGSAKDVEARAKTFRDTLSGSLRAEDVLGRPPAPTGGVESR